MNEILQLLAQLDIGRAAFLLLAFLVVWQAREIAKTIRRIELHVAESKEVIRRNSEALENLSGALKRKGIEFRKEEYTRGN